MRERSGVEYRRAPGASTKTKLENSYYAKNVLETNYFIRVNPYNVLSNIQKENFKKLPPVMCKNLMKLTFWKKLVGEAMGILQQPGMVLFENLFLHVA